jgi:hypothetical protein
MDALGNTVASGLTSVITSSLDGINNLLPAGTSVKLGDNTLAATVTLDLSSLVGSILDTPLASQDNAFSMDLTDGSLTIDLDQLLGGTLNSMTPNSLLLSQPLIDAMQNDLSETMTALEGSLSSLVSGVLDVAHVNISGKMGLNEPILGTELAGIGMTFDGSLGSLLDGSTPVHVSGEGTFGSLLDPIISTMSGLVQNAVSIAVDPLLNTSGTGMLSIAGDAFTAAANTMLQTLNPLFAMVTAAVEFTVNVQTENTDGDNTFTEIPLQVTILGDGFTLNLGKVVVGPNTYTA